MISSILQKLPVAMVGILLIVAVLTIYIRSKNVTRSEFFKIFKSLQGNAEFSLRASVDYKNFHQIFSFLQGFYRADYITDCYKNQQNKIPCSK